jgi:hypothetical protein
VAAAHARARGEHDDHGVDGGAKLREGEASTLGGIDQRDGGIPAARPPLPRRIELHNVQIELLDKQSKLNGASNIRTPHGHASAPTKKMPLRAQPPRAYELASHGDRGGAVALPRDAQPAPP